MPGSGEAGRGTLPGPAPDLPTAGGLLRATPGPALLPGAGRPCRFRSRPSAPVSEFPGAFDEVPVLTLMAVQAKLLEDLNPLLGHQRQRTTASYAHLADAHSAEAAEKVGGIISGAMCCSIPG